MQILQMIGQWISNPNSLGTAIAIKGPPGTGKTTLIKEGVSKILNRPFAFLALGGATDSSFLEGHSYTYEGSSWGKIVDIMIQSKCMNPVIYFDELDKVSETFKGEEIIHMLTHLTDPSQNSLFQDNYYPGINIDLSKVLFIFSFNDESKVNRVLKDRMYVINTKGFNTKEKIKICRDYVLPELYDTYLFKHEDIIINDDILEYVIDKFTNKEEGVRNLKRCIESIISKINIYYLTGDSNNIDLNFKIKDFKLPYIINREDIDNFLKLNNPSEQPPQYMYM
jgi:ATP-dependent Lon protease